MRLESVVRQSGEDVTAQVMRAFDDKIKPSLADYLPERDEAYPNGAGVLSRECPRARCRLTVVLGRRSLRV